MRTTTIIACFCASFFLAGCEDRAQRPSRARPEQPLGSPAPRPIKAWPRAIGAGQGRAADPLQQQAADAGIQTTVVFWPPSGRQRLGAVKYSYYVTAEGREVKHGVEELWMSERPATRPLGIVATGRKVKEQTFHHGKLIGSVKYWSQDGKIEGEIPVIEGQRSGKVKVWYASNGKTAEEGEYRNGKKVGKWTFYKEDGSVRETTEFGS